MTDAELIARLADRLEYLLIAVTMGWEVDPKDIAECSAALKLARPEIEEDPCT